MVFLKRLRIEFLKVTHLDTLYAYSQRRSSTCDNFNESLLLEHNTESKRIQRPAIPMLLVGSFLAWIASAITYSLAMQMDLEVIKLLCVASLICAALAIVCILISRGKTFFVLTVFALIAIMVSSFGAYSIRSDTVPNEPVKWRFTLTSDATSSLYGTNCYAKAICLDDFNIKELNVNINFSDDSTLLNGQVIEATTQLYAIAENKLESYWNHATIYRCNLNEYSVSSAGIIFDEIILLRSMAIDLFQDYGAECGAILNALVCGYRPPLNQSGEYDQYKVCGIAHIVAVSGAHLAIITMLLCWFLQKLRCPRRLSIAICCTFILFFLVFVGIPISAIRAAIMVVLSMFAYFAKRRSRSLNALAICILGYLALDPSVSLSVSFFLSSGSTLGIILFTPLFSTWFGGGTADSRRVHKKQSDKLKTFVVEPLSMTLSSNVVTLPFSAALFSQISLIAPIANIVVTPLFSIGCVLGLLCVMLTMALMPIFNAAPILISLAAIGVFPLKFSVGIMSKLPFACIATSLPLIPMLVASFVLVFILWRIWPIFRPKQLLTFSFCAFALVCAFVVFGQTGKTDRICMLDVGQGDSILVQSESSQVLIDTGNKKSLLKDAIAHHGIYSLDALFITHHDDDHCGAINDLVNYIAFSDVYVASELLDCNCKNCSALRQNVDKLGLSLKGLSYGDEVKVGKFIFNVIWPREFTDDGGNGDSLGFLIDYDADEDGHIEARSFLCGDAESDEEKQMISQADLGDIDVLKVGHHGSKISLDDEIANILTPDIALISCGANNRYGHPNNETLHCLDKCGAAVYRTDLSGCVDLTFSKEGIKVITEKA